MQISTIKTERMTLKIVGEKELDYLFTHLNDQELMSFMGLLSEEELQNEKSRYEGGCSTFNKKFIYFYLIDNISNKTIGWSGYHVWYTDHCRAEIGYRLFADEYMGKGLMSEVLRPIIDYGINEMNLHRIEAMVGPDNEPSLKLMQKFNFTKEGHLREHYLRDGKFEDSVVFSLLASEWH